MRFVDKKTIMKSFCLENFLLDLASIDIKYVMPGGVESWTGHTPFAYWLVNELQPKSIVELGTHFGQSYFAFCQSVKENKVDALCYAIDTWAGDKHAGEYDDSVYLSVLEHNNLHYRNFSYLLRSTFDQALSQFEDESIELLHIDGLHTYEAVKNDFENWFPKVKKNGIILIHDICVKHEDFGVWKLWDEIKVDYPSFEFTHSWGLGIIQKTENDKTCLLSTLNKNSIVIKTIVESSGMKLGYQGQLNIKKDENKQSVLDCSVKMNISDLSTQLFPTSPTNIISEENSYRQVLPEDTWQKMSFSLDKPHGIARHGFRFDPCNQVGEVQVSAYSLLRTDTGEVLFTSKDLSAVSVQGHAFKLSGDSGTLTLISTGDDPQCFFPPIPVADDVPLTLELWMRYHRTMPSLPKIIADFQSQASRIPELEAKASRIPELEAKAARLPDLETQLAEYESEEEDLTEELQKIIENYEHFEAQTARIPALEAQVARIPALETQVARIPALETQVARIPALEARIHQEATKAFRQHCLRPINPIRKFTSRKLRWIDTLLPRAALRADTFSTAYSKKEVLKNLQHILDTKQFDSAWYLETYPEVSISKLSPFHHYLKYGWKEGKNPSPHFKASESLANRPDVAQANIEPLTHFLKHGQHESK